MIVLGIETSCDETACALVDDRHRILAETILSQIAEHEPYQGVVPEIAARAHIEHLDRLIAATMREAGCEFSALDAVAATAGPGLIGGVIVGLLTAKGIAAATGKPLIAVNHLEGHALSPRLSDRVPFPYLLLLVSGGHCQLVLVQGVGHYRRLGTTIDDAVGEAYDKTAKLLGLGYPGGPAVEAAARLGDARRFVLPRPMLGRPGCDFSFSGLKTAVRQAAAAAAPLGVAARNDLAAGFEQAVAEILVDRTAQAIARVKQEQPSARHLVIAGGVAANQRLRRELGALAARHDLQMVAPPLRLCTDNGAMIAWAGLEHFRLGRRDGLDVAARARWPLDPSAPPAGFAGVKA